MPNAAANQVHAANAAVPHVQPAVHPPPDAQQAGGEPGISAQRRADLAGIDAELARLHTEKAAAENAGDFDRAQLLRQHMDSTYATRIQYSAVDNPPAVGAAGVIQHQMANPAFVVQGGVLAGGGAVGGLQTHAAAGATAPGASLAKPHYPIPASRAALCRMFRVDPTNSLADIEHADDTLMLKADGTFVSKSSKLKQIPDLNSYCLAVTMLEDYCLAAGRIAQSERHDHQMYIRRIAEFATIYDWSAVITYDDEFRRRVHAGRLPLRWRDEALGLVVSILFASLTKQRNAARGGGGGGGGGGNKKRPNGNSSGRTLKKAKFGQPGASLPDGSTVCFNFNSKNGCDGKLQNGTACTRSHVCANCGAAGHTFFACTEAEGG